MRNANGFCVRTTLLGKNQKTNKQALTPLVEGIIGRDMERFREYAEREYKSALQARAKQQQRAGAQ